MSPARRSLAWLAFLLVLATPVYALYFGHLRVPDTWNPWAPLKIEEPLHWLTRLKLDRLSRKGRCATKCSRRPRCATSPSPTTGLRRDADSTTPYGITRTTASVGEAFTLSCRSTVALALWEHHVLQPAARAHFGAGVARLEHLGSYACRNVYGRKDAPLSRHATADAIDVAGFVLENGRRIRIERDWKGGDANGAFLRDVRDGACRVFDGVLGPDYNAAHRDHLHLDRGGWRVCR